MWFDIIIILILICGLVLGYMRGFMAQIGAVIGIFFAIICCQIFGDAVAAKFGSPGDSEGTLLLNEVMAYVIIFILCYVLGRLIGLLLSKTTKFLHLSPLDKVAGAVFKVAEYLLCLSVALNLWIGIFPDTELRTKHDGIANFVIDFAPTILGSETANEILGQVSETSENAKVLIDVLD